MAVSPSSPSGKTMAESARHFLESLASEQRAKAVLPFATDERMNWHYVPRERAGLPLKGLSEEQRKQAMGLLHAGLSQRGYLKATTIMSLENVLREIEAGQGPVRDPDLYYFTIFGAPSETEAWGWRVEGHHVSLNFSVVKGHLIADTPQFLGANPAEVLSGPQKGLRALPKEEDMARELLHSLNEKQSQVAVWNVTAPADIITGAARTVEFQSPKGIAYKDLTADQQKLLMTLLEEYARTMPDDLAKARMEKLHKAGLDAIHFAWAGGKEKGQPHYYCIQGPTFLVEYDDTQNNANHIHTVWRDFSGDWGEDLLREHYDHGHHRKEKG